MKRIFGLFLILTTCLLLPTQGQDTLNQVQLELAEIAITATQTMRKVTELPAQIDIIDKSEIEAFALNNVDDLLKVSSNINVNRSWGIFSKNSSVTMRGLEGSARTLVLVDGVPKNKLGGGSVNWHNINPANIERIEIIKGPASSLYGNNAMGGVINIITKKPKQKFEGQLDGFLGSFGTRGGGLNLSGSEVKNDKGIYWNLNGFYRQGDGYIFEPPDFIDETDVPTYLKEYGGGGKIGYQLSKDNNIEIVYDYYDEIRGAGRKVFLEDGSYESYKTNQFKTKYTGKIGNGDVNTILYYNSEDFFGQKESMNDYGEYKLLDSYSKKGDYGIWTTYSRQIITNNTLTMGFEGKAGSLDGDEIYRTSADVINYDSRMNILGLFIQDEMELFNQDLRLTGGIRIDHVNFAGGSQSVLNPSSVTGFTNSFVEDFKPNTWTAISPKLALHYNISNRTSAYASYSVGFMPPGLKDLAQTGKIRKGFRIANPELKPEYLSSYELGYKGLVGEKVSLNGAVYYSIGRDFQYMVNTGDSIDTGGSSLKPVMKPENIARIGIVGGELSMTYYLNKNLRFNTGYSYNSSKIIEYNDGDSDSENSLVGNYIAEVSPHLFYANLNYHRRLFYINLNCNYVSEQWFDDENTIKLDDYFLLNARISRDIKQSFNLYLHVQNILDNEYIDRKGQLSPGRFLILGLKYRLGNQ